MPDLVPVVFFDALSFFLYSDRKKTFFFVIGLHLRKIQLQDPIHNIYGGRTVCIGTGFKHHIKTVTLHHDLFQSFRKTISLAEFSFTYKRLSDCS